MIVVETVAWLLYPCCFQSDFLKRSEELQDHLSSVLQENKLLTQQVQALDMQNKQLELLNAGQQGL